MIPTNSLRFFLGGRDLEMITIADLVRDSLGANAVVDYALAWGAKASAYADEIAAWSTGGGTPVLVELVLDIALPPSAILIDHHGNRSAEPSSLRQVFSLLQMPDATWTRWHELVSVNDCAHIAGLRAFGANCEEIARVRGSDRAAQGITLAQEQEGLVALQAIKPLGETGVWLVHLSHNRTATVTDPLAISGDMRDLLILSPTEVNFFGSGARIARLDGAFPEGWLGGNLPARGFWGRAGTADLDLIEHALKI